MWQQAQDFKDECDELNDFLKTIPDDQWSTPTPFKNWTINHVVAHLHGTDIVATMAINEPQAFIELRDGKRQRDAINVKGHRLLDAWCQGYRRLCDALNTTSPNDRVLWFGPDMSARSFATARQMETWAHGQDIYDLLEVKRAPQDRLRNVAHIGVITFGWTFVNRKMKVPTPQPHVRLTAPSGDIWTWNEVRKNHLVEGSAVEFCHVVTQGRHIDDTTLRVVGDSAKQWMPIAQCFAGPPEDPPAPGVRTFISID